jgi:hypothetical protein
LSGAFTKICHPERSIAIGFFNRNAESRDLVAPRRNHHLAKKQMCTKTVYNGAIMPMAKRQSAKAVRAKHVRRSVTLPAKGPVGVSNTRRKRPDEIWGQTGRLPDFR